MSNNKEIKDITVKEFVEGYKKMTNDTARIAYVREHLCLRREYIPIIEKIELSKIIVENFTKSNTGDYIQLNSVLKYLFYKKMLIQQYTNIIIESPGFWEEYDMLKEEGLLDVVTLAIIPDDELEEFNDILEMTWNDYINNYIEPHVFIDRQFTRVKVLLENIFEPIIEKASDIINGMSEEDDRKIANIVKEAIKKVKG